MKLFNSIGIEEREAVLRVLDSGKPLSGYIGSEPYGGDECCGLEIEWTKKFNVSYAVAVNSATSGLLAACMAAKVGPGDTVIVPAFTMSATAAAPKVLGANIVYCDVDQETFGLDPKCLGRLIHEDEVKAVIVTNLFGIPARLHQIKSMCNDLGVFMIEDNSQSAGAKESGVYTGTIGDIGVFSLNVHKHIQCGEGGVVVTNNGILAQRLRGAMNHGEMRHGDPGLNLRMTEITAAIAREQLKKLDGIIRRRRQIAERLSVGLLDCNRFVTPVERSGCENVYYTYPLITKCGWAHREIARDQCSVLNSGYTLASGYISGTGNTPVSIYLHTNSLLNFETCTFDPTDEEIDSMINALKG